MIKKTIAFSRYVLKNAKLDKDSLAALQDRKIRRIAEHAYNTTVFYRRLFNNAGVQPGDISGVKDLLRIPPVTKEDIQNNYGEFLSDKYNIDKCFLRTTSGSSGKVLRVVWDIANFWSRVLLFYRAFSMIGYSPFKKMVYFLPVTEDTGFSFGLFRHMPMTFSKPMEEVKKILIGYKPEIISIYPSYAVDLGSHFTSKEIAEMGVKAISLNSEMILSYEKSRIEEIYRCPVYEEYSCVEAGMVAAMCRSGSRHIFADNVVLEILDSDGNPVHPGERGEIVLTALNSRAMPFIRYRIGDYSCLTEELCSCGSRFPVLGPIEGRKDDSFKMKDGRLVPSWQIYEVVERPLEKYGMDKLVLKDFYLIQKKYDLAEFYYVKGPDFQQRYIDDLSSSVLNLFGDGFAFRILEADDIDRVKNVKRKYVHCAL